MIQFIDINGTPYHKLEDKSKLIIAMLNDKHCFIIIRDGGLWPLSGDARSLDKPEEGFIMTECSYKCYKAYTTFLRSKNYTHFLIAQRRFTNEHKRQC